MASASTPAQGIAKADSVQKDKESVPPAKRPEEPKGGKETAISPSNSGALKTEKEALSNSASTPPAAVSALATEEKAREASPPRVVVALPIAALPASVDSLSLVPVTDKCTHLTAGKTAPVLTHTLSISLSTFFRRVMADGTNTWMLALRDPNADSFFTQGPWAASKEVRGEVFF